MSHRRLFAKRAHRDLKPRPVKARHEIRNQTFRAAASKLVNQYQNSCQCPLPSTLPCILQAVGLVRVESCSTQAVLPLVGLAADKVIRDRYSG
ncbi:MAG: hypothetical protein ACQESR_06375 [Planctomycetota bacterium]